MWYQLMTGKGGHSSMQSVFALDRVVRFWLGGQPNQTNAHCITEEKSYL